MGTQQLLLIIVGTVVVIIAVMVGINLFWSEAQSSNRDALSNELIHESALAAQWRRKPALFGGGSNTTFVGYRLSKTENMDGSFNIRSAEATVLTIEAHGTEIGRDGTHPVLLVVRVVADSAVSYVSELN